MQRSNARIKLDRHLGSAFYQLMAAACVHVAWLRKSSGQFGLALDALKTVKLERAVGAKFELWPRRHLQRNKR